jgi:hypothetical protein
MADSLGTHWHPMAAYLYVLHLDAPALAWEYLRRSPEYRRDWMRRRRSSDDVPAHRWGLRVLEDPSSDARDVRPTWLSDPERLVQLCPLAETCAEQDGFDLWQLPGHKHLTHDGDRLVLTCELAGHVLRGAIPAALGDGMPYAYAVLAGSRLGERWRAVEGDIALWETMGTGRWAVAYERPGRAALLHLRALQALDGTLAGASQREIAEVLFGRSTVATRWSEDSDLRAQVRRLIQRGRVLMRGGYRRLVDAGVPGKGRSH